MIDSKFFPGVEPEEINAAMTEEGCAHCFGCPHASIRAAVIVNRSNLLLQMATFPDEHAHDLRERLNSTLDKERTELAELTSNCAGFSDVPRAEGRPVNMCDSPASPDGKLKLLAGRFLELIHLY